ncbi:MAG: glycosyltransferase family 4 protein [bacterium]
MPQRILHINLTTTALLHYSVHFARALHNTLPEGALSILEQRASESQLLTKTLHQIPVHYLPFRTLKDKLHTLRRVVDIARNYHPDIIHFTDGFERPLYGFYLFPMLSRLAPIVATVHDPVPHSGVKLSIIDRFAARMAETHCSQFIVHGPECKKQALKRGLPAQKISVIRHGILDLLTTPNGSTITREPETILYFGRFQPNKGADLLPEISEKVHSVFPNARFIVAGEISGLLRGKASQHWIQSFRIMLASMKHSRYFEVHDRYIRDEEVEQFFHRASIVLLPYRDASQSGVASLAMAYGNAIVATRVGDLPEIIEQNVTGLLCDPTPTDLSAGICQLLSRPEDIVRLGNAAQDFIHRECNWHKIMEQTVTMYNTL